MAYLKLRAPQGSIRILARANEQGASNPEQEPNSRRAVLQGLAVPLNDNAWEQLS